MNNFSKAISSGVLSILFLASADGMAAAANSTISNAKISDLNVYSGTEMSLRLRTLSGSQILNSPGSPGCSSFFGVFLVRMDVEQSIVTGVENSDHLKLLYAQAAAAIATDKVVNVNVTFDNASASPVCHVSGIGIKGD